MAGPVTVADVMGLSVMQDTRVIAGARGLSRRISAISVIAGTEMVNWVKSGAIAISTGHPFAHLTVDSAGLIDDLVDLGVACLAIRLGSYLDELPEPILREANQRGLPIIQLSDRHSFDEIILTIMRELDSMRLPDADLVAEARLQVRDSYLRHGSLADCVDALTAVVFGRVVVYNEFGDVLVDSDPVAGELALDADPSHFPFSHVVMDPDDRGMTMRLGSPTLPIGWIRSVAAQDQRGEASAAILEAVADIVTMAIRHFRVVAEATAPYLTEILHDLVADDPARVRRGVDRVEAVGFTTSGSYQIAVVEVSAGSSGDGTAIDGLLERIASAAGHASGAGPSSVQGSRSRGAVIGRVGEDLVILSRADRLNSVIAAVGRSRAAIAGRETDAGRRGVAGERDSPADARIAIGMSGEFASLWEVRRGYLQAKMAAVSDETSEGSGTHRFDDIGLIGSLVVDSDRRGLIDLCLGVLSGLRELAPRERPVYVQTLQILIDTNYNFAESARLLYCHYNTIRYRVARMKPLIGDFTDDLRARTNLALCFEILRLVGAEDSILALLDRNQDGSAATALEREDQP